MTDAFDRPKTALPSACYYPGQPTPSESELDLKTHTALSQRLNDGDRVFVIGGGPAGSFFAVHLLREACVWSTSRSFPRAIS